MPEKLNFPARARIMRTMIDGETQVFGQVISTSRTSV